ncbi:hypothetical protein NPIL_92151 [Nephila pilipes]|uniref:Uncharacterized protein n=1 Tax=Nephila pilipes TaxID=299642 RepID=A0A8X6P4E4_NEPPI|nr:hypothetical protein NPIL_92151 [Nephila pilipes]
MASNWLEECQPIELIAIFSRKLSSEATDPVWASLWVEEPTYIRLKDWKITLPFFTSDSALDFFLIYEIKKNVIVNSAQVLQCRHSGCSEKGNPAF